MNKIQKIKNYPKFFALIEKQPALWHVEENAFRYPTIIKEIWLGICREMIPRFDSYSVAVQDKTAMVLKKKWRNLKDCHRKCQRLNRKSVHAPYLQFLNTNKKQLNKIALNRRNLLFYDNFPITFYDINSYDKNFVCPEMNQCHADLSDKESICSMQDINNVDELIKLVKMRPGLWDIHDENYSNLSLKDTLWTEVCKSIDPSCNEDKINDLKNLIKEKWKSLYDSYHSPLEYNGVKEHSNKLSFLKDHHLNIKVESSFKVLDKLDSFKLIAIIKEHPNIWDPTKYIDHSVRHNNWVNIAAVYYSDFHTCHEDEQLRRVYKVKNKWRTILCTHRNQVKRWAHRPNCKTKYTAALDFMKDINTGNNSASVQDRSDLDEPTISNHIIHSSDTSDNDTSSNEDNKSGIEDEQEIEFKPLKLCNVKMGESSSLSSDINMDEYSSMSEVNPLHSDSCNICGTKDPDRQFLLSLEAYYKKLTDEQKLDYKIVALQFLRNAQKMTL